MTRKESAFLTLVIFMVLASLMACNKKAALPTASDNGLTPTITLTRTATPAPADNTTYSFENGTVMNWAKKLGGVSGVVNSTDHAYLGTHSLKLNGSFTGGASNSAEVAPPVPNNLSGMKVIARVYIPSDFPSTGGCIYIQSGPSSCWEQGPWVNGFTKGGWTTLELNVDAPASISGSNPDHTNVSILGINFNPAANYTGAVYFDSINIASSGSPTSTRTITTTHTVSPTPSDTITGTPPTQTVTPTVTMTPTYVSTAINPADMGSNVMYFGRWSTATPSTPQNGWGATYMVAGFDGTSVALNFTAYDSWLEYAVDDFSDHTAFTKFRINSNPTPYVISGLADTSHTIMVVRRDEGWGGKVTFKGIGLDTNKTMTAPSYTAPTRKMEFIGDSITCGSGTEYAWGVPTPAADLPCDYGKCVQNGDLTYGMQLARLYGAEGRTICRGGAGIYRNCGSSCDPDISMADYYPFTFFEAAPSSATFTWNFASWQADVVVIALGTNDFSQGIPDETGFKTAYSNFISALRGYYPNAYILCMEPIPSWVNATAGTYINAVVAAKNTGGDAKVYYIGLNHDPENGGNPINADFPLSVTEYANDNTHPIASAHTKVANAIKTWMDAHVLSGLQANNGW